MNHECMIHELMNREFIDVTAVYTNSPNLWLVEFFDQFQPFLEGLFLTEFLKEILQPLSV